MEVRIAHPNVEGFQRPDLTWQYDPEKPNVTEPPMTVNVGNALGYCDVDTDSFNFEENEVEFTAEQPSKAATKWVAEFMKTNPQDKWDTANK